MDKKELLSKLLYMDYSLGDATQELKYLLGWFRSLPNELTLYRLIKADSFGDIRMDKPGSHYAMDKEDLMKSHSFVDGVGDKTFLITVRTTKDQIDKEETLSNRILYPHENEITLKKKGKNVTLLSVKELK